MATGPRTGSLGINFGNTAYSQAPRALDCTSNSSDQPETANSIPATDPASKNGSRCVKRLQTRLATTPLHHRYTFNLRLSKRTRPAAIPHVQRPGRTLPQASHSRQQRLQDALPSTQSTTPPFSHLRTVSTPAEVRLNECWSPKPVPLPRDASRTGNAKTATEHDLPSQKPQRENAISKVPKPDHQLPLHTGSAVAAISTTGRPLTRGRGPFSPAAATERENQSRSPRAQRTTPLPPKHAGRQRNAAAVSPLHQGCSTPTQTTAL